MDAEKKTFWRYAYFTDDVAARAREGDLLQDIVLALVNIAADCDMLATGKLISSSEDHADSYHYLRDILNRLGIPPQAILDVIDEYRPGDDRENLTERDSVIDVVVEEIGGRGYVGSNCGLTLVP